MGSLEELFVRIEAEGLTDKDDIIDWLRTKKSGKKSKRESYLNVAIELSDIAITNKQVRESDSIHELRTLIKYAESLPAFSKETIHSIKEKIKRLQNIINKSLVELKSGKKIAGMQYNKNIYVIIIKTKYGEFAQYRDFMTGRIVSNRELKI